MPSAEDVNTRVAGSRWFSTADGVAGFNQIKNTAFASQVLAIVSMSGKHLPTSLVFGPRNGPEDFSKFGYRIFKRKLFRTWFLFVDDVCVLPQGKGTIMKLPRAPSWSASCRPYRRWRKKGPFSVLGRSSLPTRTRQPIG